MLTQILKASSLGYFKDHPLVHLFFLFILMISQTVNNSTIPLYADEAHLCLQSNDLPWLSVAMNEDLCIVSCS